MTCVVSPVAVSSSSVRVFWSPVVDHYTAHNGRVGSGIQFDSGTASFPACSSSGVMSGLQEGQQYQFSVNATLLIDGQTYTGTTGEPFTAYISQLCSYTVTVAMLTFNINFFRVYK